MIVVVVVVVVVVVARRGLHQRDVGFLGGGHVSKGSQVQQYKNHLPNNRRSQIRCGCTLYHKHRRENVWKDEGAMIERQEVQVVIVRR